MNEDIDINKELQQKNQEMLLNKKRIDLDTSMESLFVFYSNYATNIATEINNRVCAYHEIDSNSEQGKIFYNIIISFFSMVSNKLKEIISTNIEPVKSKLSIITDEEYSELLSTVSNNMIKEINDYCFNNIYMLNSEINQDVSEDVKYCIDNYLNEIINVKMINMLKDKFMFAIKVISNNYVENKEVIENINEKTIK